MTFEEIKQAFEEWFREKYSWEIRRAVRGRKGYHLDMFEGAYLSEIADHDFSVWCEAYQRMLKK